MSTKLDHLDRISGADIARKIAISGKKGKTDNHNESLKSTPYSEAGTERKISFPQRKLNAMIAKNTDFAKKLTIDLYIG